ncbi:hypothetical protein RFI_00725 [Reticulomyxa filosa]|uniref:Caspase family p20 domain-containing protein n=1 Tax=Reticulomyxa filosa TaxID=46433 RepID=X6PDR1_RETFI|nr:hypothetical protein RFI_00725 [Reticulomyxa filosa]|eukprot:ETO36336.1 hypothetical protein RFI_00725 [Reticulomyxa filosa]
MSFQASVYFENKSHEVTLTSLSLKSLEDKVKEILNNRTQSKNLLQFKIRDINGQNIDNNQKLRIAFDTNPVRLFIHFINKNNDEEMKYPDVETQNIKTIELDQNKPWIEANKRALRIVNEMIEERQKGIVIVSINLDQFAKSNDQKNFQDIHFSMMINSKQYMKKKIISPYTVYSFHSKNIKFDNITIDGCVYVIDCMIDGIGHFHITQHLIHTKKSVINYTFKQPIFIEKNSYKILNFDKAISLIRFVLCVRLQTLDDSDILVGYAFGYLGDAYHGKGEYDKAIEYHEKALKIKLDKLGSDYIDVAKSYRRLGNAYYMKVEYDKAIEYYEKALKITSDELGSGHIDVRNLYNRLGHAYKSKGSYDKEIQYFEKALEIELTQLGPGHTYVITSYNNLGNAYESIRKYDKALEYHQKVLEIRSEKLDSNHIDIASSYNNLGSVYYMKTNYDEAYEYHKKALDIYSKKIDGNQIDVAICYNHLGNIHYGKRNYAESIEYYKKCLKISLEQLNENHIDVVIWSYNLGNSYLETGEYETSIKYHENALNIILKKFDVLGLILEKNGTNEEVIQYFEKPLEIRRKNLNDDRLYIGLSFHYLASAFKNNNILNKSIEFGEKALELRLNKLDCNHPHIGESYVLLGDIHFAKRNKTKARKYYEKAIKIFNQRFGEQHQKTQNVKLTLEKINEKEKGLKWWDERDENDKAKIIEKYEQLTRNDFITWLLNQNKWKNDLKNEYIFAIRVAIELYIDCHSIDNSNQDHKQEKKENEVLFFLFLIYCKFQQAYVIVNETKKLIKMKDLTLEELTRQSYSCLDLTFELVDMKNNVINSDKAVKQAFMTKEPSFKIRSRSLQQLIISGKYKIIKNALVVMIGISEYIYTTEWPNIPNVKKKDVKNFKKLFEQELNYQFVCNQSPQMTKKDVQVFMDRLFVDFELRTNAKQYDGLIMIICGHGKNGNMLVTSDGKSLSIDEIRASFNCDKMESFKNFPKIFIIDVCRGENIPTSQTMAMRGKVEKKEDIRLLGHNDDGFLMIWSTTQGYQIGDFSLLSSSMKSVVKSKYKSGYPFKQMFDDIRQEIRKRSSGEWYCIETQDTTSYDMIFVAKRTP